MTSKFHEANSLSCAENEFLAPNNVYLTPPQNYDAALPQSVGAW